MNEGREEKKAEQFFLKKFGCTSKAKVMQEHFIGLSVIHKCIDAIEEYAADQLSKERETVSLREAQQDVMAADTVKLMDQLEYQNKAVKETTDKISKLQFELKKEREMRKELVEGISKFVHHWRIYFNSPKVGQPPNLSDLESLLAKASELDKNLKAHNEGKSYNEFDQEQRGWKPK